MTQNGAKDGRLSRWRAAWYVLMGQRLTPLQIEAQWIDYQVIFNDLLARWSSYLARDAKVQKERIKRDKENNPPTTPPPADRAVGTKAELRRKVATMRGFGLTDLNPKELPDELVS